MTIIIIIFTEFIHARSYSIYLICIIPFNIYNYLWILKKNYLITHPSLAIILFPSFLCRKISWKTWLRTIVSHFSFSIFSGTCSNRAFVLNILPKFLLHRSTVISLLPNSVVIPHYSSTDSIWSILFPNPLEFCKCSSLFTSHFFSVSLVVSMSFSNFRYWNALELSSQTHYLSTQLSKECYSVSWPQIIAIYLLIPNLHSFVIDLRLLQETTCQWASLIYYIKNNIIIILYIKVTYERHLYKDSIYYVP